jgi:hypothetical protein
MNTLQKTVIYFKMFAKEMLRKPSRKIFFGAVRYFPSWRRSLLNDKNSVSDSMPWLAFAAIDFLRKIIRPEMSVFEYGSGGSTLFWSQHVRNVVSIEHEQSWYNRMKNELLNRQIKNVQYVLSEAEQDESTAKGDFRDPEQYASSDSQFARNSFKSYVRQIERFSNQSFDIIIVDGRARPSCILHSIDKVKKGGYLIIDNTEREYYLSPFTFALSGWKVWKFYGPVPYSHNFSETTIIQKPLT